MDRANRVSAPMASAAVMAARAGRRLAMVASSEAAAAKAVVDGRSSMTVRDALNSALDEELKRDKNVFILGEEV